MNIEEKVKFYEQAIQTIENLKKAGAKVTFNMSVLDKIYFAIKSWQTRNNKPMLQLNEGTQELKRNFREELRKSVEVKQPQNQHIVKQHEREQEKMKSEKIEEESEMVQ